MKTKFWVLEGPGRDSDSVGRVLESKEVETEWETYFLYW